MTNNNLEALEPWKESLFRLPESTFLNIVRLYVGVIKTPYNKERLVTELISFLYKDEHKDIILSLLSEKDILFLSAVHYLEKITTDTLLTFFSGEYTTFFLYDYIANLEERLLIYRHFDDRTKKEYLTLNPLLQQPLQEYLSLSALIPVSRQEGGSTKNTKKMLSASLFSSWYAFTSEYPDACRADGSFKKKVHPILEKSFYGVPIDFLETLNTSFVNLGLFYHDGAALFPSEKKWEAFCQLSQAVQNLYICIASFRRFPREALAKYAAFFNTFLENIPKEGVSKEILLRLIFLLKNTQVDTRTEQKKGYFTSMLQRAQGASNEEGFSDGLIVEKMIFFGLLEAVGNDAQNKKIYVAAIGCTDKDSTGEEKPFISINAGFSITFLKAVSLEMMLPLVRSMNIVSYDTVCRFEITRVSCMRSFDKGETNESLLSRLEKASGKPLSQNLIFSINEWYETYNSASLYHGYILKVSPEKIVHIENSAILASRIRKILAPGIYLLDFETKEELLSAVEKSALDFIGNVKQGEKEEVVIPFINAQKKAALSFDFTPKKAEIDKVGLGHIKKMKEELEKQDLPKEQKEGLLERIQRKLIISPKQLIGETVRHEKTEASGIDFMGKIQVVEQAISSSNMIEITSANNVYTGRPLKVEKRDGDASITLVQEDTTTVTLLIGQARNVKRFRQPLF